jgi:predicted negative regulator of RcsB-dependent stress response
MKSEERHKLQQNELADWLAKTITTIKPYQNAIISGIIVLVLAVIFLTWWTSESSTQAGTTWKQYIEGISAGNTGALEKMAEDNPHSQASTAANLAAADIKLAEGCNMLFINKATANQELSKAAELYQRVRDQAKSPAILGQATFGLARTRESQGKLDEAIQLYTKAAGEFPNSVFAQMSTKRLDDLKLTSTKEMYDRFAQFDPKPAFSKPSGEKTGIDKIPDESPLYMPESITEPGSGEKKDDKADVKAEDKTDVKTDDKAGVTTGVETEETKPVEKGETDAKSTTDTP